MKRPNAYRQVLEEAQKRVTQPEQQPILQPENRITAQPQNGIPEPAQQLEQDEEKATEKLTLYLFPRHSDNSMFALLEREWQERTPCGIKEKNKTL